MNDRDEVAPRPFDLREDADEVFRVNFESIRAGERIACRVVCGADSPTSIPGDEAA